ncbi:DJ-1 protein-like protein E [Dichanthelium oligosanthes]|uniref:DJ-1 protein-like protein E n=1 Tax=Dichanthelium oligosanthes TaxID=888268 RepID=A0A1E5UUZ9_9POAL|nr:DJ-1 protein-like protein E [Dichanthelium oligosanthes]
MAPSRRVLMLCGDYMEDYEAAVPLYALAALGLAVDCVAPGKQPGESCLTAVHDFLGFELYTELPGHRFEVNADFEVAAADPSRYDALIIPGGRFTEPLSADAEAVELVAAFAALKRPLVVTCHSQLMLAAAGGMGGVRCTAFFSMRPVVELAGGTWVDPDPFGLCVADGHVLSAIGWPAHAEIIAKLLAGMGARVDAGRGGQRVLILCADYVDDYEANVPFRALAGVGCRVEAACPTKRKGEPLVTAIYDAPAAPGAAVSEERRGHNFVVTSDWADVSADDYDCVVVPGGRAPELLVTHEKAVALVREFGDKGKVVASIDQGHLLLAAAGLLRGKKCASGVPMRVVSRLAGADALETEGAVVDGKLVTAASWPDLSLFVAHLVDLLNITVSF